MASSNKGRSGGHRRGDVWDSTEEERDEWIDTDGLLCLWYKSWGSIDGERDLGKADGTKSVLCLPRELYEEPRDSTEEERDGRTGTTM